MTLMLLKMWKGRRYRKQSRFRKSMSSPEICLRRRINQPRAMGNRRGATASKLNMIISTMKSLVLFSA
jgi:hypothetical protein